MRIAARAQIGALNLKWLVKDSITAEPSYQNHYLMVTHAVLPLLSRIEFMGHRETDAAQMYDLAVKNAGASSVA